MKKKCYPTLVKAAENITQTELCQAPASLTVAAKWVFRPWLLLKPL